MSRGMIVTLKLRYKDRQQTLDQRNRHFINSPLRMNAAQVRVLEQIHNVSFTCLLQCTQRSSREPKVALEPLRDLTDLKLTEKFNFRTEIQCVKSKKLLTNRWNGAILIKSSVDF